MSELLAVAGRDFHRAYCGDWENRSSSGDGAARMLLTGADMSLGRARGQYTRSH